MFLLQGLKMTHLLLAIIYISFISLGLPDSVLGAAWPSMQRQLDVPLSYAGIISMIIALGTVVSSLQSDRLTFKLGTGKVTTLSVAVTALALYGFSVSDSFWLLCLWAIPYGLGAGAVDASLNNYVVLHYASRHMSWLHCMWGVGASLGPYILGFALLNGNQWDSGYLYIAILQVGLSAILLLSLPLWKKRPAMQTENSEPIKPMKLSEVLRIPNAKNMMLAFFCYSGIEQTSGLWASSYFVLEKGVEAEMAASFGSLFFIGITIGRGVSGFLTMKLNNDQMVKLGLTLIALGIATLFIPFGEYSTLVGLIVIGLGCAPIYPCFIHSTPYFFGEDKSQAIIGVQMASAYIGTFLLPPFFGILANHVSISLLPFYLAVLLVLMALAYRQLAHNHQR